jgi:L-ascorbate metabolism protein UlaG (beta-lactamase superfamily)
MFYERVKHDFQREVLSAPMVPRFTGLPASGVHAAWIGHSTVWLSIDGFQILTDPVFSTRIGIGIGPITLGMKRLVAPAAALRTLPTPDLIVLSHAHMDHFDLPSLRALEDKKTTVITASKTSDLLRVKRYGSVNELAWNESIQVGPVNVRAFEVKHWGARMQSDTYRGYNGYTIESGGYRILFGGDTAYTNTFRSVRSSKPFDLAIMPIGAYDPWIYAHCNPEEAVRMADDAGALRILPVHHKTFTLSNEPLNQPIERLLSAVGSAIDRVSIRDIGGELHFA